MDGSKVLERAIGIAVRAHAGQLYPARDGERGPYVLHLFRVMLAVEGWQARTAAVLHDVIEDTPVTAAELREAGIPPRVVDAVVALTHRPEDSYEAYIEALAPHALAREVKLADLADNLATNLALPPSEAAPPASPATKPPSRASPIHIGNGVPVLCRPQGDKGQKPPREDGRGRSFREGRGRPGGHGRGERGRAGGRRRRRR